MSDQQIVPGPLSGLERDDGVVETPHHCGEPMEDVGGCPEGCCDDYRCRVCGKKIRIEWSD